MKRLCTPTLAVALLLSNVAMAGETGDPMPVYLPPERQANTIAAMHDENVRWTVPWAMYANRSGQLCLQPSFPVSSTMQGTMNMRVERKDGQYRIDISNDKDVKWERSQWDDCNIPVVEAKF